MIPAISVLCPVLFAVFTAVSLYAQNQTEVELSLLWPPMGLGTLAALALFGLFMLISRNAAKSGVLSSLVVAAFFFYGLFLDQRPSWLVVIWLALFVVGVVAVVRTSREVVSLVFVLFVVAVVMVAPPAASIVSYHREHPSISAIDLRLWPTALEPPTVTSGSQRPDIFVLIPDDFARSDVLARYLEYDDRPFLRQLRRRGFVVSGDARSPYAYSEMNIASLLNLDYLSSWPRVVGRTSQDFVAVKRAEEDNRAARMLTSIGYDYVHLDTDEVTFSGGNPGISALAPHDSFANLWLQKSILGQVGGPLGFNLTARNERFRHSIHAEFSALASVPTTGEPKFAVFHTLLPHDPYIFGADGQSVTFPAHADHASAHGIPYYVRQVEYLQRLLLNAIDQIQARPGPPPVILLQADEGFEVNPDVVGGEGSAADIRVKGLSAFAIPGADHPGVPSPPNSVNSLRFVFNEVLGTHYEMLDSVSHLEGDLPFDFTTIAVP